MESNITRISYTPSAMLTYLNQLKRVQAKHMQKRGKQTEVMQRIIESIRYYENGNN